MRVRLALIMAWAAAWALACASAPPTPPRDAGPAAGEICACFGVGPCGACESATRVLYCDPTGHFVAYPCPGANGCRISSTGGPLCDFSRVVAGDPCPPSLEGNGTCLAHTPGAVGICRGELWTQVACPAGQVCTAPGDGGTLGCR